MRKYLARLGRKHEGPPRTIKVRDFTDMINKTRTVSVECPLEYPGLSERERRMMYEGLAKVTEAFRLADERIKRDYERKL